MMNEKTGEGVRRLPKVSMGDPEDGVELMAKCQMTNFTVKKKEVVGVGSQHLANCKMMALLKEAADYHNEKFEEGGEEDGECGSAESG